MLAEKEAQQSVFHFHVHLVPRYLNDGLNLWYTSQPKIKPLNFKDLEMIAEAAEKLKKSQSWVSYRLGLVERLAPETREAFITRVIDATHAREIAALSKEDQAAVADKVVKNGLSSRKTVALVQAIKEHPEAKQEILAKPVEVVAPLLEDLQKFLRSMVWSSLSFSEWACEVCGGGVCG